jgi:hypothetical protein
MAKSTDNEILRDAIEVFIVQHFDTIELAGCVQQEKRGSVNYFSIDLNNYEWDKNVDSLNAELSKYLTAWVRKNSNAFNDYISLSDITVEYLLPEANGSVQNKAKSIRLFYLPSYYYATSVNTEGSVTKTKILLLWLNIWNTLVYRNVIFSSLFILLLIVISCCYFYKFPDELDRISKVFEFTNVASGIIASFILGFIVNKVSAIRAEKLKRVPEILKLSNQLTYFRKVCFNFLRDHNYWNTANPYITSFKHGESIKNLISYEDFYYPSYGDPVKYAKYKSLINEDVSFPIVNLVLQLYMFSDEDYFNSGLTYTEYPKNYVYSFEEMQNFILMEDSNQIWYCCEEGKYFPDIFPVSYYSNEMLKDIKRIDKKYKTNTLTKKLLSKVSLDFQYGIIPRLYHLTKLNEAPLPPIISYFKITTSLILIFGIIVPSVLYVFLPNKNYAFFSIYIVLGTIVHILLSLGILLKEENKLDRVDDYM